MAFILGNRKVLAAAAVAFFATAGASPRHALGETLILRGAGSTFSAPLYERWIRGFADENPAIAVRYDAVGSGEGVARFVANAVDFGASDVPLAPVEAARVARGAIQAPGTAGMIVLAYNLPGVAGELKLPQDVYVDIFLGRIRNWDDPRIKAANSGLALPSRTIAVVVRQDSSGTTFALTSHLAAISKRWTDEGPGVGKLVAWPQGAMSAKGSEGLAARIKISEGAIGYVEYGFAHRLGLPVATLQNKAGQFAPPTPETGAVALAASAGSSLDGLAASLTNPDGAGAYPIVTYSWLLLYGTYPAERARAVAAFVDWGLGEGQTFAAGLGYLPLPPAIAALGKSALSRVKAADGRGE
jgi:phosphate transport system substrate-binding protein